MALLFGSKLRDARKDAGITQFDLAQRAGLSQTALSKAENAHTLHAAGASTTVERINAALASPGTEDAASLSCAAILEETVIGQYHPDKHRFSDVEAVIREVSRARCPLPTYLSPSAAVWLCAAADIRTREEFVSIEALLFEVTRQLLIARGEIRVVEAQPLVASAEGSR